MTKTEKEERLSDEERAAREEFGFEEGTAAGGGPIEEAELSDKAIRDPFTPHPDDGLRVIKEIEGTIEELEWVAESHRAWRLGPKQVETRELPRGTDPHLLSQSGWAVVFPEKRRREVETNLGSLLQQRRRQAGEIHLVGVPEGTSAQALLAQRKQSPGVIDPRRLPYYLMIYGDPEELDFEFQYQLAISRSVGRLHLSSNAAYQSYCNAVVKAEDGSGRAPEGALVFSRANDSALQVFDEFLMRPLEEWLTCWLQGWQIASARGEEAKAALLRRQLESNLDQRPLALWLASCHGFAFTSGSADQELKQGSLSCSDRPFSAGEVSGEADLSGQIAILLACFSAGTPATDNFPQWDSVNRRFFASSSLEVKPQDLALKNFTAALPTALLTQGALAVVGHVDKGWGCSAAWRHGDEVFSAAQSFKDMLHGLIDGERLGHAFRPLARRQTALGAKILDTVDRFRKGYKINFDRLNLLWTAYHDARNLIILGDPAVYLTGKSRARPKVSLPYDLFVDLSRQAAEQNRTIDKLIENRLKQQTRQYR